MSKPFFEVFPTLKAGEDMCNMFEGAQVLKVTTNSDRTFLRVHIVSRHLIQKTLVYEMEHLIKNQLFTLEQTWQVALCVYAWNILFAYLCLKLYDEPVRRYLAKR